MSRTSFGRIDRFVAASGRWRPVRASNAAMQERREDERNGRQRVDQKREMPVDVGEIARKRRGEYERQVVDRGAVSQLPDAVLSGEVGDDESCRKRDDHTGSDAEDAADEDQRRDVADEQAGDARSAGRSRVRRPESAVCRGRPTVSPTAARTG